MIRHLKLIIATTLLCDTASASEIACMHPEERNRTFLIAGDEGVYTWDDHGIKRSWALKCNRQQGGFTACHRWEHHGNKGSSAMVFRMLADGTLIEAGSFALLDSSMVTVTPGYVCTTQND